MNERLCLLLLYVFNLDICYATTSPSDIQLADRAAAVRWPMLAVVDVVVGVMGLVAAEIYLRPSHITRGSNKSHKNNHNQKQQANALIARAGCLLAEDSAIQIR